MRPLEPIAGRFLYVGWNFHLRMIGPFVLPSTARRHQLANLGEFMDDLRSLAGINDIRLLETTFVVPRRDAPRFDVALLINGSGEAIDSARNVIGGCELAMPSFVSTGHNVVRFGDTDAAEGPILLNHFTSSRSAEDVTSVWTGISTWYAETLGVDNSTLLTLDDPSRFIAVNYAAVPAPVPWFLANQLVRPSFRSKVVGPLATVNARALPIFARRVSVYRQLQEEIPWK